MEQLGLAKSSEPLITNSPVQQESGNPPVMVDGVPLEIIRYFDVDIRSMDSNTVRQLKDIYELSNDSNETIGDSLLKIKDIDMRLGYPSYGNRFSKVWNYLKITKNIGDLDKQRQALTRN